MSSRHIRRARLLAQQHEENLADVPANESSDEDEGETERVTCGFAALLGSDDSDESDSDSDQDSEEGSTQLTVPLPKQSKLTLTPHTTLKDDDDAILEKAAQEAEAGRRALALNEAKATV